ncbi:CLUMA_CG020226, isoform A [Clunio marinus]|uniref:CLUMA_CG020226, isoform A n=1 Tax=Clunio marinus TaxID=568069 RepID=A0A1J1J700_9DIPT|nr:CLUMA_CG020226, isoform A [Clunio marinus]
MLYRLTCINLASYEVESHEIFPCFLLDVMVCTIRLPLLLLLFLTPSLRKLYNIMLLIHKLENRKG